MICDKDTDTFFMAAYRLFEMTDNKDAKRRVEKKMADYGKKYTLKANGFKRKGYTFKGWNTKKNGKGKTYKNKAKIKNLTAKSKGKVVLYAQWKKKKLNTICVPRQIVSFLSERQ